MQRRLVAILAADVVGYSRLMGEDEAGTLAALKAHREDLIEPKIAEHEGRVVKLMGDGILAEFGSVVAAVQSAVEIQEAMAERNGDVPAERRIDFRVGINLGDVIVEGTTFTAMESTSLRAWRAWPSPAASAWPRTFTIR